MLIHIFSGLKQKQFQLNCESKNKDRGWFPHELNPRLAVSHIFLTEWCFILYLYIVYVFILHVLYFYFFGLFFALFIFSLWKTELKTQSLASSEDGVACVSMIVT